MKTLVKVDAGDSAACVEVDDKGVNVFVVQSDSGGATVSTRSYTASSEVFALAVPSVYVGAMQFNVQESHSVELLWRSFELKSNISTHWIVPGVIFVVALVDHKNVVFVASAEVIRTACRIGGVENDKIVVGSRQHAFLGAMTVNCDTVR